MNEFSMHGTNNGYMKHKVESLADYEMKSIKLIMLLLDEVKIWECKQKVATKGSFLSSTKYCMRSVLEAWCMY